MSKHGVLLVLSSPSGGGKTTLCNRLSEIFPNLRYSTSMTTRPPRPYEIDGEDYLFVSEEEFFRRQKNGEFIEWAKVHDNYYGTLYSHVNELLDAGYDVILDIDTQGAATIKGKVPQAVFVFILPPSLESLAERLYKRDENCGVDKQIILDRLSAAKTEISHLGLYNYVVVNDDVEVATETLKSILIAEKARTDHLDLDQIINSEKFDFLLEM